MMQSFVLSVVFRSLSVAASSEREEEESTAEEEEEEKEGEEAAVAGGEEVVATAAAEVEEASPMPMRLRALVKSLFGQNLIFFAFLRIAFRFGPFFIIFFFLLLCLKSVASFEREQCDFCNEKGREA